VPKAKNTVFEVTSDSIISLMSFCLNQSVLLLFSHFLWPLKLIVYMYCIIMLFSKVVFKTEIYILLIKKDKV
jgi:hypothetical protein